MYTLSLEMSVAEWRKGRQVSFYMHRKVATAGVQERLLGDHQGLSRDRVNPSYSPYIPHSARHHDWERLWQGSCRDWLATVVCREKTPVICLPTVLRPASDDITVSKDAGSHQIIPYW